MLSEDLNQNYLTEVAKACDFCLKPCSYSIINNSGNQKNYNDDKTIDLILIGECRSNVGKRLPENDLEIEIYRSGLDISITLSWLFFHNKPILWHGKYSLWMDSSIGSRVDTPDDAYKLEALARRLRSSFYLDE